MTPAIWMWGGAAVVAASGYVVAGIQTVRLAREQAAHLSEVAEIRQAQRQAVDEAQMRANQAAIRYEEWKAAQRPKIITVVKEVDRALQTNSAWATEPIPVSVRDAIEAARTLDATAKPESALPALGSRASGHER
jgi:hypothetical protein